jgi:hypothetical protein
MNRQLVWKAVAAFALFNIAAGCPQSATNATVAVTGTPGSGSGQPGSAPGVGTPKSINGQFVDVPASLKNLDVTHDDCGGGLLVTSPVHVLISPGEVAVFPVSSVGGHSPEIIWYCETGNGSPSPERTVCHSGSTYARITHEPGRGFWTESFGPGP